MRQNGRQLLSINAPRVDAKVQIHFESDDDLRDYLPEPFASRGFPHVDVSWYAPPWPKYVNRPHPVERGTHPGSEPDVVGAEVITALGNDYAILHPASAATLLPDWHLGSAILAATNRMLVERWLDAGAYREHFRGTIRVNTRDIEGAVAEIDRWADHPRVAQVGIALQSLDPFGAARFKPLWRAACEHNLPVAIAIESGMGTSHPSTPSGPPRTYRHHFLYQPLAFVWHLLNMIAEGVFEEFPDLEIVFTDGGADMMTPMLWRFDTFGRPHLDQTPWAPQLPSRYVEDRVFFVHGLLDGPPHPSIAAEWLRMTGKEQHVLYGSSYPAWHMVTPDQLPDGWTAAQSAGVAGGTAARLYGLPAIDGISARGTEPNGAHR